MMILAYCKDNHPTAKELGTVLRNAGIIAQHVSCSSLDENEGLHQLLLSREEPVLLLISDNFLKSEACVQNALEMLQTLIDQDRV
ncbi:MAG: hypothetical protein AAFO94_00775, partial [Bacteroidota bacterium]